MFELNGVRERSKKDTFFEIYAFEACPLLAHATQLRCDVLNNEVVDLPVEFSEFRGMSEYVNKCYLENLPWNTRLSKYFKYYERSLINKISSKGSFSSLLSFTTAEVKNKLNIANINNFECTRDYFFLFPFAVGAENSFIQMTWYESNYMNGGGNILGLNYGKPTHYFEVPVIRLADWIRNSFDKNDFIYIKMDIEGMEFQVLEDLINSNCLEYINEMDIEWHGRFDVPKKELEEYLRKSIIDAGIILRDHY
jgi:FkbM family methyltransferase